MSELISKAHDILGKMNIKTICHIDDFYEREKDFKDVILAQLDKVSSPVLSEIFTKHDKECVDDLDIDKKTLISIWDDLTLTEINSLTKCLEGCVETWDTKASSLIEVLFSTCTLIKMSPSAWEQNKAEFIKELSDNKILFLFDNDWGTGGDSGFNQILDLINNVNIPKQNLLCGLYTHTIGTKEENKKRIELAKQYSLDKDRFLVISKQHEDSSFICSLATTALLPTLNKFRAKVFELITQATRDVEQKVKEFDIVDLEYMILNKSKEEGDWEPKILYRIHKNKHLKEFRNIIFNNEVEIQSIINEMRAVKQYTIDNMIVPTNETKTIMQEELFDTKVNEYQCPLRLGDIFELNSKKYLLLAQPCDLSVRSTGKRANEEFRCFANLVEINNKGDNNDYKLEYFSEESHYINFSKAYKVSLNILDLCTYSKTGNTLIDVKITEQAHRLEGLSKRYTYIQKQVSNEFKLYKSLINHCDKESKTALKKKIFLPMNQKIYNRLSIDVDKQTIDYGLRRISNLAIDKARDVLTEFLRHAGRAAYETDLAKIDSKEY